MYKSLRYVRVIVSLIAMGVPAWALVAGYDSVFVRMQVLTSIMGGAALCLVFWAAVTLIYGRIYCSTVCPMGALMDCAATVSRLLRRKNKNYFYCKPSRRTRAVFLAITFVTLLSGSALIPTLFDPYSAYARMIEEFLARPLGRAYYATAYSISTMAVAVLTALGVIYFSMRRGRLICNTVCPVGTLLGIGGRYSYFHMEIDPDRCIGCGECVRVCKSECIDLPKRCVDNSRCVICFNCTASCPSGAMNYKSGKYRLGMPMMQSIDEARRRPAANMGSPMQTDKPIDK